MRPSVVSRTDAGKSGCYHTVTTNQQGWPTAILRRTPVTNFYFRISDGQFSSSVNHAIELVDRDAAWRELTLVSKDLVGDIAREMRQNAEWQMELLDETKKPIFRIRLVAETLDNPSWQIAADQKQNGAGSTERTALRGQ
jgi:hypothetical protein